ncbi:MAG: cytochrome C oxidase subunit IV family protein [Bacillota bacterium]|nr:cytochrome C oxidase subunit IV family protein [Bacillota bacterium]MDI3316332.1 cytochrome C oxidase subunit IV family protein [Bacillota bacterium]
MSARSEATGRRAENEHPIGAYVISTVVAALLTVAAVVLAYAHVAIGLLAPLLLAMALVQIFLQIYYLMHLNRSPRAYQVIFGIGVALAVLIGVALGVLDRIP